MKYSFFHKTRIGIIFYTAILVTIAININNIWLAIGVVTSGVLAMWLIKRSLHIRTTDERTASIAGKAAGMTYAIVTTALAVFSLLFLIWFSHIPYLKSLGIIFSYLVCIVIGLYSLLYMLFDKSNNDF